MKIEKIKVILGDEYDENLRNTLRNVMLNKHAISVDKSWGVGGSQEVETWHVMLGNDLLVIEAETYVGLSIVGPKLIVEGIVEQMRDQIFQDRSISRKTFDSVEQPLSPTF